MPRTRAEVEEFKARLRQLRAGVQIWYLNGDAEVIAAGFVRLTEEPGKEPVLMVDVNRAHSVVALDDAFDDEAAAETESEQRRPPPARVVGPHG